MISPQLPKFIFSVITDDVENRKKAYQFLFLFQGNFYSHSFFTSIVITEYGTSTTYSFGDTKRLYKEDFEIRQDYYSVSRWFRFNEDYDFISNIDMIIDGDDEIEQIELKTVLQEIRRKEIYQTH